MKTHNHQQDATARNKSRAVANEAAKASAQLHQPIAVAQAQPVQPASPEPVVSTNQAGLPDGLKTGIEQLSGYAMDDVNVHYNSSKPAQLHALAYAQDSDIHLAPGQEKHLPHEAWHVVQQKQGRVQPTWQLKRDVPINDDANLEREADIMGAKATAHTTNTAQPIALRQVAPQTATAQRLTGYEVETNLPVFGPHNDASAGLSDKGKKGFTSAIGIFLSGGLKYGFNYGEDPEGRFHISADHNDIMSKHRQLVQKLLLLGLLKPGWKHRSLANAEYITPPRPELGPNSMGEHKADIAAVRAHVNTALGVAKGGKVTAVPAPAHNIFTGIPVQDLVDWVKGAGMEEQLIIPEIYALSNAITNAVYIQETSGVLPADIPKVYDVASKAMGRDSAGKVSKIMSELMAKSNEIGAASFQSDKDPFKGFADHKGAVVGYLTLLASYALADNLSFLEFYSKSSSTAKNLVPFMSKTKLVEASKALPAPVHINSTNESVWGDLTGHVANLAKKYDTAYWSGKYGMGIDKTRTKGKVFPDGADYAMLQLQIEMEPTVGAATGRLIGLDDPHPEVEKASGQKAIPLEDRYFGQKHDEDLTSDNMEGVLAGHFQFATDLNFDHLPGEKKGEVAGSMKTPPNADQQVLIMAGRIRQLIAAYHKLDDTKDLGPWNTAVDDALKKGTPDAKQAALKLVLADVHQELTLANEKRNALINAQSDDDPALTIRDAKKYLAEDWKKEVNVEYTAYTKKGLKPEQLKEKTDQDTFKAMDAKALKFGGMLYRNSDQLEKLPDTASEGELLKLLDTIRKLRLIVPKLYKDAAEFHNKAAKLGKEQAVSGKPPLN